MQPTAEHTAAATEVCAELVEPALLLRAILGGLAGAARDVASENDADSRDIETLGRQTQELAEAKAELQLFARLLLFDLEEPLRKVATYTELLQQRHGGRVSEDADELIRSAVVAVEHVRRQIDDLRASSRRGRALTFVAR